MTAPLMLLLARLLTRKLFIQFLPLSLGDCAAAAAAWHAGKRVAETMMMAYSGQGNVEVGICICVCVRVCARLDGEGIKWAGRRARD